MILSSHEADLRSINKPQKKRTTLTNNICDRWMIKSGHPPSVGKYHFKIQREHTGRSTMNLTAKPASTAMRACL